MPIIRIEIERMEHTLAAFLTEYEVQFDQDVQNAIKTFFQPEKLSAYIEEVTDKALQDVIKEEVRNFFMFGPGRQLVKEKIAAVVMGK